MKHWLFTLCIAIAVVFAGQGQAALFCTPPLAPTPTSEALAKEYMKEFTAEFETYFGEAQTYIACLDTQRSEAIRELQETTVRYSRFIGDSQHWGAQPGQELLHQNEEVDEYE